MEILGYILVFSVVLAATTVVVLFGTSALGQIQSATAADNGEFAIRAIGSDLEAIHYGSAVVRNTELTLGSASLETGPPAVLNVTAVRYVDDDYDVADDNYTSRVVATNASYTYQPVIYTTGNTDIVYSNTLIIRDQQRGTVALNDPQFAIDENRAVIPAIQTNASVQGVGGSTHQMHSAFVKSNGTTVAADPDVPADSTSYVAVNLTVRTTPDWRVAWERVLNETLADVTNPRDSPQCRRHGEGAISCHFLTDRLVVSNTTIEYDFR